jgi:hypothetical protein
LIALLSLVAAFVGIALAARRAQELFVLSVRNGATRVKRGRIPPALLEALADVMQRASVQQATLRAVRHGDYASLEAEGLTEPVLQRARNVLGTFPLHKLLSAPAKRRRRR